MTAQISSDHRKGKKYNFNPRKKFLATWVVNEDDNSYTVILSMMSAEENNIYGKLFTVLKI